MSFFTIVSFRLLKLIKYKSQFNYSVVPILRAMVILVTGSHISPSTFVFVCFCLFAKVPSVEFI